MKLKHIGIVFKKEVKDIIRDKKTIITALVVPVILMPVLLILMGGSVQKMQKDINENVSIALSERSNTQEIKKQVQDRIIKENPNINLVELKGDPVEAIRKEEVRLVLDFDADYAQKLKDKKPFNIKVMYDHSKAKSDGSFGIIEQSVSKFNAVVVQERLKELGIDPAILEPSKEERTDVADPQAGGNPMLMMLLPMLITILIASGGIAPATDLVAGEKERQTFEPLLTTKPDRLSILLGKYLTVTAFSIVSVLATLIGYAIGFLVNPSAVNMGIQSDVGGFSMPVLATMFAVIIAITLGMTFAGIQIAVSTYAKSFKEAQTYLSMLIIVAMIPSYATMFMQPGDIQSYMFLIPLLNTISAFKMVLGGIINYTHLIIAMVSSIIYVAAALGLAAWMFSREEVLFRS